MLGCGPNTTPSLCHLVAFDVIPDGRRWFPGMCLVEGGGGGKEGGREGIGGLGQTASDARAPSCQSASRGTIGDWGVGVSTAIGLAGLSSTGDVDTCVGADVGGGREGRQSAS